MEGCGIVGSGGEVRDGVSVARGRRRESLSGSMEGEAKRGEVRFGGGDRGRVS